MSAPFHFLSFCNIYGWYIFAKLCNKTGRLERKNGNKCQKKGWNRYQPNDYRRLSRFWLVTGKNYMKKRGEIWEMYVPYYQVWGAFLRVYQASERAPKGWKRLQKAKVDKIKCNIYTDTWTPWNVSVSGMTMTAQACICLRSDQKAWNPFSCMVWFPWIRMPILKLWST